MGVGGYRRHRRVPQRFSAGVAGDRVWALLDTSGWGRLASSGSAEGEGNSAHGCPRFTRKRTEPHFRKSREGVTRHPRGGSSDARIFRVPAVGADFRWPVSEYGFPRSQDGRGGGKQKHSPQPQAAWRISRRSQISASASVSSRIMASVWPGPGVKRNRSVPRGTVGKLIGCT